MSRGKVVRGGAMHEWYAMGDVHTAFIGFVAGHGGHRFLRDRDGWLCYSMRFALGASVDWPVC